MSGATAAPDRAGVRSGDRAAARADRDSPGPGRAAEPEPAPGAAPRGGSRRGGLTGSGVRRASRPPPAWRLAVEAGPGLAVAGGRWLDGSLVEADRWAVGDAGGWWPGGAAGAGSRAAGRRGGGPRAVAGRAGGLMARCPARRPVPGLPAASNKRGAGSSLRRRLCPSAAPTTSSTSSASPATAAASSPTASPASRRPGSGRCRSFSSTSGSPMPSPTSIGDMPGRWSFRAASGRPA